MNAEFSKALPDNDGPELTDEQLKIMNLVLSHKGQAMDALKIPSSEYEKYASVI